MRYMLDTNICIDAILGGSRHLDERLDECSAGDLVISAVTLGELEVGFARSADPNLARSDAAVVLSSIEVMPFDVATPAPSGAYRPSRPLGAVPTIGRLLPTRSRRA